MEYVRRHTSIPVPAIIETHFESTTGKEQSWFLMQRIPGVELGVAWPNMTEGARFKAIQQLRLYFGRLRRLQPPGPEWIGSCSRGAVYDHRLNNRFGCGPFPTVGDFHYFLVASLRHCPRPDWVPKYRSQLRDTYGIHFAHADLSWENILLDPSRGHVNGILDWEMAWFWPAWWEYRKAVFRSRS